MLILAWDPYGTYMYLERVRYNQRTIERSQNAAYIMIFFRGSIKYVQGPGRVLEGWDPKSEGFPGKRGRPRPVELSVLAPRLF